MRDAKSERAGRRWRVWLLGIVALGFAVLYFLRGPIALRAGAFFAQRAGFAVTIESLRFHGLSRIEADGIVLEAERAGSNLRSIRARSLAVEWSWTDLLAGRGLACLDVVRGDGLQVDVDLTRKSAPSGKPNTTLRVLHDIAEALPDVLVEDVAIDVRLSPEFVVQGTSGRLTRLGDGVALDTTLALFEGVGGARITLDARALGAYIDASGVRVEQIFQQWARGTDDPPRARAAVSVVFQLPLADARAFTVEGHVDARDLAWSSATAESVEGDVTVDWRSLVISNARATSGANVLELAYLVSPLRALGPCMFEQGAVASFRTEIEDLPALLGAQLDPALSSLSHVVSLSGRAENGALDLGPGLVHLRSGDLALARGTVPLHDRWRDVLSDPRLELSLWAKFDDLRDIGALLGPRAGSEPWSGSVSADAFVRGGPEGPRGRVELEASDLSMYGRHLAALAFDATLERSLVRVAALEARTSGAALEGTGVYRLEDGLFEDLDLRARVDDVAVLELPGLSAGRVAAELVGDGGWPRFDGSLAVTIDDVRWRDSGPWVGALDARLRADSPIDVRAWLDLDCDRLQMHAALTPAPAGGAWHARIEDLVTTAGERALTLVEPVDVRIAADSVELAGLHASGTAGDLVVDLSLRADDGNVRAKLVGFDPAPIARFLPLGVSCDQLDCDVDASWSASDVTATVDVATRRLRVEKYSPPVDVVLRGRLADKRLELRELSATSDGVRVIDAHGSLPLDVTGSERIPEGPLALRGWMALSDLSRLPLEWQQRTGFPGGSAYIDLALTGTTRAPRGRVLLSGESLVWSQEITIGPCAVSGDLELADDLFVRSFAIDFDNAARMEAKGSVGAVEDWLGALAAREPLPEAPIDLDVSLVAADLAPLAGGLRDRVRRLGGVVTGQLEVRGTLAEPSFQGELHLAEGEVRTSTSLPSIQGVTADLVFDGPLVRVENVEGELGGAPFQVKGEIRLAGDERGLTLALTGKNLLLYRQGGVTLRADADLAIEGPLEELDISGAVAVTQSRFARELDLLTLPTAQRRRAGVRGIEIFSLTDAPLADARFDVRVTAKEAIRVTNRRINGALRPSLRLLGTGRLPILVGSLQVEPTRVNLPASEIFVRAGEIEFRSEDPFVPVVELKADARLRGYEVTIHVTGPYDAPTIDLTSTPPLPREDLLLLVIAGRAPSGTSTAGSDLDVTRDLAIFLASDTFGSLLGSGGGSGESFADRIEVTTGQDTTESGAPTMRVSVLLERGVWRKNDELFVTGERDEYDRYNYGVRLLFRFP